MSTGRRAEKRKTDENGSLVFGLYRKVGVVPNEPVSRSWCSAVELGDEWRPLSLFRQAPNSGVCSCTCGNVGKVGDVGPSKRAIDRGLRQCT